ncbi:MAG: GTPase [Bacilli bacterium]
MIKRCTGCGVKLQTEDKSKIGYINPKVSDECSVCTRCFKIKNYGQTQCITKKVEFNKLIKTISKENTLILFLVDILNITPESIEYYKSITTPKILLLTKKDLLPKSIKDKKLIAYLNEEYLIHDDIVCISSTKKTNIDSLIRLLNRKNIKNIYLVGKTNAGKSTLINSLSNSLGHITNIVTSEIPNTTIDFIKIKIGDYTFIDTPGFITETSIYNFLKPSEIKRITPKKEIKVKTIQIKEGFTVIVSDILRIDFVKGSTNSFSFYMNNHLLYSKMKIVTSDKLIVLPKKHLCVSGNEDIVINGLGFIKITKEAQVVVYTLDESLISKRKNLI